MIYIITILHETQLVCCCLKINVCALTRFGIQMVASQTRNVNSYLVVNIPVGRTQAHAQIQKFHINVIGMVLRPYPEEFKSSTFLHIVHI
jgi:hypothetical protein